MLKIGWFSTARGESSRKLLGAVVNSIRCGQLNGQIEFVFCSREKGEAENTDVFLDEVISYNIPLVTFSVRKFADSHQQDISVANKLLPDWRLKYDQQVMLKLSSYKPDICVLAGYMLIVGPEMCSRFNMINLHPALPDGPKGTWQEVIRQLISQQATESGVMMHLVTNDLDRGPVITYSKFPIRGPEFDNLWAEINKDLPDILKDKRCETSRLFQLIREKGFIREIPLIVHTLKAISEGKIRIGQDKKLLDANCNPVQSYDLTGEIDRELSSAN